jgi:hypothetical protein
LYNGRCSEGCGGQGGGLKKFPAVETVGHGQIFRVKKSIPTNISTIRAAREPQRLHSCSLCTANEAELWVKRAFFRTFGLPKNGSAPS